MEILISIKHKYAERIYKGTKKYELRKVTPNIIPGTICLIYEPLPIGKVTGQFVYAGSIMVDKNLFWEKFNNELGITLDEYLKYFKGHEYVHAWKIKKPMRYQLQFNPRDIDQYPPQSYTIISKD